MAKLNPRHEQRQFGVPWANGRAQVTPGLIEAVLMQLDSDGLKLPKVSDPVRAITDLAANPSGVAGDKTGRRPGRAANHRGSGTHCRASSGS